MEVKYLIYGIEIANADWKKTPACVQELVEKLVEQLAEKEAEIQELLEKINWTSNNSLSDPLHAPKLHQKKKSGKKRGEQLGQIILDFGRSQDSAWEINEASLSFCSISAILALKFTRRIA